MQPDNHQSTHHNLQASWTDGGMRVGSTSGSLPPVPPNVRSVRGSDVLVYEHLTLWFGYLCHHSGTFVLGKFKDTIHFTISFYMEQECT